MLPRFVMMCAAWLCVTGALLGHAENTNVAGVGSMQTYSVTGIVKQVQIDEQKVIVQHDAVPGYMPAMTMPFRWKDKEPPPLKEGEQIRFRLLVTENESWIDQVTNTLISATSAPPATAVRLEKPRHPMMQAVFTNELNQPVRLADYQGQALALTFFFTSCPIPEYCPRLSKNFQEASHKLASMNSIPTNWHFLSVTFDNVTDTPAVLKNYGERYSYDPRVWSFWTGSPEQVAELARLSDATFKKGTEGFYEHNFRTLIIDPSGKLQMSFPVGGDLSGMIVTEILKALSVTNRP